MKSKNIRLEKIRRFIRDHEVGTQEEIVEHLKEEGISATQATVSRDIKELGIVKRPLKDMTYVYELPRKHHQRDRDDRKQYLVSSSHGRICQFHHGSRDSAFSQTSLAGDL